MLPLCRAIAGCSLPCRVLGCDRVLTWILCFAVRRQNLLDPFCIFSRTFLQTVTAVPVQTAHGRCEQHEAAKAHKSTGWALQGMRLARGGTSTLPMPARESPSRLAANARAAVMDTMADQRNAREKGPAPPERGSVRAGTKVAASELHSEMAPPGSNKLGVRPLLGSTGNLEGWPCSATAEAVRSTSGGEWCDEGGVNGDLGSIPKRKAVGNDLYSALVWPPRLDVQVPKETKDIIMLLGGRHAQQVLPCGQLKTCGGQGVAGQAKGVQGKW